MNVTLLKATNEALIAGLEEPIDLWIADPNWPYSQTGGGDPKKFRSTAKREYSIGRYWQIAATLAAAAEKTSPDGVLALWVTAPQKGDVAAKVTGPLQAWGLWRYAATIYWHKTGAPGIGQWVRNNVEEIQLFSRSGKLPAHLRGHIRKREKGDDRAKVPCFRNWLEASEGLLHESNPRTKEDGSVHSEKPWKLEQKVIERFCQPGGRVGSLWSGMFPTGRAALAAGFDCVGAEPDEERHGEALAKLEAFEESFLPA